MKVVGGILQIQNKILIAKRKLDDHHPGLWEYPGGKVELNETQEEALKREFFEELNIKIFNPIKIITYNFNYNSSKQINLNFYKIYDFFGVIKCNFHLELRLIKLNELKNYEFLEGDVKVNELLINAS